MAHKRIFFLKNTKKPKNGETWKRGVLPEFGKKVQASLDAVFGKEKKIRIK